MKIKRFQAPDIRQALRLVKESLGPDAVILSNNAIEGGIELVAAIDVEDAVEASAPPRKPAAGSFNNALRQARAQQTTSRETRPEGQAPAERPAHDDVVTDFRQRNKTPVDRRAPSTREHRHGDQAQTIRRASQSFGKPSTGRPGNAPSGDADVDRLREEIAGVRRMLEAGFSSLSWQRTGEQNPERQHLFRRLMGLGISADIANHLLTRAPLGEDVEEGWHRAVHSLASALPVVEDHVLDEGGVIALVGPTGVGKTTTLAKIAARFCLRHGKQQLALVTTDHYRIGARDQLNTYARILDIPIRTASSEEELHDTLESLADRRLILIDTAGMSQKDVRLSEQMAMLQAGSQPVKTWLTLPATIQQQTAEQVIRAFRVARLSACVLTKLDESVSLGGVVSALIRTGLPLNYVTDGQRVPEDLHPARAFQLLEQAAAQLPPEDELSDDYLAMAFAGAGNYANG
ncbi:MAG TPA: flagellar biosynthesis protein FlhF [Chromatiaceae bacterium]|nr:flagellar biosynthesis protein FlhF [Chromatiaceae bacterium]